MDTILQGIPRVQCILDDKIVTGDSDQTHYENLETVISCLSEYGLKLNKDKCQFLQNKVTYCGHAIDKTGLWKCNDKIQSVLDTPVPQNVTTLRAYLGVLNYYHRFLPNLSTVVSPLNALLQKDQKDLWSNECDKAFKDSKRLTTSEPVLTYYNPELPVRLATDASPVGISGILSHVMPDGSEKTDSICVAFLDKGGTQIRANRQVSVSNLLGSKTILYVFVWLTFFTLVTDCQPLTLT